MLHRLKCGAKEIYPPNRIKSPGPHLIRTIIVLKNGFRRKLPTFIILSVTVCQIKKDNLIELSNSILLCDEQSNKLNVIKQKQ